MMSVKPVLIMAGGTGGHVFPALAVADELRSRGVPIVWLGTRNGIEARVVKVDPVEHRIGLTPGGGHVAATVRAPWEEILTAQIEDSGLSVLSYHREIDHWLVPVSRPWSGRPGWRSIQMCSPATPGRACWARNWAARRRCRSPWPGCCTSRSP